MQAVPKPPDGTSTVALGWARLGELRGVRIHHVAQLGLAMNPATPSSSARHCSGGRLTIPEPAPLIQSVNNWERGALSSVWAP